MQVKIGFVLYYRMLLQGSGRPDGRESSGRLRELPGGLRGSLGPPPLRLGSDKSRPHSAAVREAAAGEAKRPQSERSFLRLLKVALTPQRLYGLQNLQANGRRVSPLFIHAKKEGFTPQP